MQNLFAKDATTFGIYVSKITNTHFSNDTLIITALKDILYNIDQLKNTINNKADDKDSEETYEDFANGCKALFTSIAKYLELLKKNQILTIKQKISNNANVAKKFNNIGLFTMNLISLYGNMIEVYTKKLQYKVFTIKHDLNDRKKVYYHNIAYQESVDNLLREDDATNTSSSQKIADNIVMVFDKFGDLLNSGVDILGKYVGDLFIKLGRGAEEVSYSIKIINEKGFDGFLDDPRCIACVRDAVIYGIIFLIVWSIVKGILRRVGAFLSWLGK